MLTTHMRRFVAVLVLVLGGVLAGCGGGGDDDDGVASIDENAAADESDDQGGDDTSGPGGGRIDDSEMQDAMLEYAQCMRDNGIDMPDPEFNGEGGVSLGLGPDGGIDPESEEFKAAEEECQPILEEARPDVQLSPEEQAEMQDKLTAMAECMRARGHDMPDPQVADDGGVMIRSEAEAAGPGGPGGGPPDEEFEQDMEECSEEAGMGDRGGFSRSTDGEGDESDDAQDGEDG
jgi:hypothetical protein